MLFTMRFKNVLDYFILETIKLFAFIVCFE